MSPTILKDSPVTSYKPPQQTILLSPRLASEHMEIERAAVVKAEEMNAELKLAQS
jgi:hypothetical protein